MLPSIYFIYHKLLYNHSLALRDYTSISQIPHNTYNKGRSYNTDYQIIQTK